ncbi:hypothetical protein Sru01_31730 [Sphaerisporangium rufum]|uniref:PPM-type phosphatase domain-containing protein n=1 Tax=Sphaerisporangium rufum TaxID=1381558 RepID=A0A919UYM0_9ACTN|nr:hypothetical protein Sru01_31730 [Sphaerisporangium rufum]
MPLALVAAITVADLLTPAEIQLSPLLIIAPALTATVAGPRFTGLVGAVAIADQVFLDVRAHLLGSRLFQSQLAALVILTVYFVASAYLRERNREKLVLVRSIAEVAQRALLRPIPPRLGPLRLARVYLAAQQEAQIGGDLYAAARAGTVTRLLIGDVRGKGLPSVSDAALLLGAFREAARHDIGLAEIARYLDESVRADPAERDDSGPEFSENFITAAVLEIPDDRPTVDVVDCGHPPPLLLRDGEITALQAARPAPPLGLGELAPATAHQAESFEFRAGDILLLYTDGVIEARCPAGRFYPLADRARAWAGDDPEDLVGFLRADLLAYVGGRLGDDAALLALRRLPDQVPPGR